METQESKHTFSIPENFTMHATKDTAQYIFQQAEKSLNETIETEKLITDRCYRFLAFAAPAALTFIGIAAVKVTAEKYDVTLVLAVVSSLLLISAVGALYKNFFPKSLYLSGSRPSRLMNTRTLEMFQNYHPGGAITDNDLVTIRKDRQVIAFYLWEARSYENRINKNTEQNESRSAKLSRALGIVVVMVVIDQVILFTNITYQIYLYLH